LRTSCTIAGDAARAGGGDGAGAFAMLGSADGGRAAAGGAGSARVGSGVATRGINSTSGAVDATCTGGDGGALATDTGSGGT